MRPIQSHLNHLRKKGSAQDVEDYIMQMLKEGKDKIKSLRLQISEGVEKSVKCQLKEQIKSLTNQESSLRRILRRNNIEREKEQANKRLIAINKELRIIKKQKTELVSAILLHKKALKKAKKEESKAAREAKIADLKKEYSEVSRKMFALNSELKYSRRF